MYLVDIIHGAIFSALWWIPNVVSIEGVRISGRIKFLCLVRLFGVLPNKGHR